VPTRRLAIAVAVNVLLTVAQVVGGVLAGSLALVADALHNLSDAASLAVALAARRIAARASDRRRTFGYGRAEVVAALINLTLLVAVGVYLAAEAVGRVFAPHEPQGWPIVAIAGLALLVDTATAWLTRSGARTSMNIRAAYLHNVADALASVGVMAAGAAIILYGWHWADLAATLAIAAWVVWHGLSEMRGAVRILMESAPEGLDIDAVADAMERVPCVREVHHVHVWQVGEHETALEAHVVVDAADLARIEEIKAAVKRALREEHGIGHSTLEVELEGAAEADGHARDRVPRRGGGASC
jgi:cobalt-zinc-cadmium efflux system protein